MAAAASLAHPPARSFDRPSAVDAFALLGGRSRSHSRSCCSPDGRQCGGGGCSETNDDVDGNGGNGGGGSRFAFHATAAATRCDARQRAQRPDDVARAAPLACVL